MSLDSVSVTLLAHAYHSPAHQSTCLTHALGGVSPGQSGGRARRSGRRQPNPANTRVAQGARNGGARRRAAQVGRELAAMPRADGAVRQRRGDAGARPHRPQRGGEDDDDGYGGEYTSDFARRWLC